MFKRVLISRGIFRWKVSVFDAADIKIGQFSYFSYERAESNAIKYATFCQCKLEGIR